MTASIRSRLRIDDMPRASAKKPNSANGVISGYSGPFSGKYPKRTEPATFVVTSEGLPAGLRQSGFEAPVTLAPMAESVSPLVLVASRRDYRGPFKFTVRVRDAAQTFTLAREVEFMGPDARLLEDEEHEEREKKAKEHHDPKG